jgi:SAM-dependent methyltransferase
MSTATLASVEERALRSGGISADPIYRTVAEVLARRCPPGVLLLDVGCGTGGLWPHVRERVGRYVGADVLRHEGFPHDLELVAVDLDSQRVPLPDGSADVVVAVETIEHLENPRSFLRELVRLARPGGGTVIVTTPNQLSLLSKLTLVCKNQFNAFQDGSYPAHLSALLEVDLRRMAAECGLVDVEIRYTASGRLPGVPWHYPRWLSRLLPRALSDNVVLAAVVPAGGTGAP